MTEEQVIHPLSITYSRENIKSMTKGKGLCGLENLGNTCYMNSIVQCLSNTEWFREFFMTGEYKSLDKMNQIQSIMINEMNKLLRGLWYDNAIVSPKGFFNYLQILSLKIGGGQFVGNNQNDSSELLIFILDTIHEGLAKPIDTPFIEQDVSGFSETEQSRYYAAKHWYNIYKSGMSPIAENFYNQLHSNIVCSSCGESSINYDPSIMLTLPIPESKGQISIYDCLDLYTSEETLDNDNKYKCEKCGELSNATKKVGIWTTSKYLIICFKRFMQNTQKNCAPISYPVDDLDMSKYVINGESGTNYRLYGISNHVGSLGGGHYFSYCRNGDKWYEYDDKMVHLLREDAIVTNGAYVLFYERIKK